MDQVHLIFSWKVTQKTKGAFDELKDIVEQHDEYSEEGLKEVANGVKSGVS